ncbi:outer membrane protein assembly factor BamB family protein [Butyrivibrio sp. XBB1001]|uniref:outer membrane protein assembly factor BamB family protein n=1 Tax=Butyrivibrio sp. XBB1001 TaxID=1280682 RepID=UPI00047B59C9|nr:TIR domain-containing protein [Butyrivibrio sp. XBB1001]
MSLHYNAFISYKHAELDNKVAAQIEKALERYHIPKKIQKKTGVKKIERIFRDKDELPITSDLSGTIEDALRNSDYLIVLCSKSTCLSTWVEREITIFLQDHPIDRVLTVLAEGEPYEVIPKMLLSRTFQRLNSMGQVETVTEPVEPLSCDWRLPLKEAKNTELPRLAAALIGCSYNELMNRQRQYKMKRLTAMAAGVMGLSVGFGAYMLYSNHRVNENYQKALISQSKYLATESSRLLDEEQRINALYLALEALPNEENPDKPVVPEAVKALSNASLAYENRSGAGVTAVWNYTMPDVVSEMVFADGGEYIAAIDRSHNVKAWKCSSHELVYTFSSQLDPVKKIYFADEKSFVIQGSHTLKAIDITNGQVIWEKDDLFDDYTSLSGYYNVLTDGSILIGTTRDGIFKVSISNGEVIDNYIIESEDAYAKSINFGDFRVSPKGDKIAFLGNVDDGLCIVVYDLNSNSLIYRDLEEMGCFANNQTLDEYKWIDDNSICLAVGREWTESNFGFLTMEVMEPETENIFCINSEDLSLRWSNDFISNAILYDYGFVDLPNISAFAYYSGDICEVWDKKTGERINRFDFTDTIVGIMMSKDDDYPGFFLRNGATGTVGNSKERSADSVSLMYYFINDIEKAVANRGVYIIKDSSSEIIYYGVGVCDESFEEFKDSPTYPYTPFEELIIDGDKLAVMRTEDEKAIISFFDVNTKELLGEVPLDLNTYKCKLIGFENGVASIKYYENDKTSLFRVKADTMEVREIVIARDSSIGTSSLPIFKDGKLIYLDSMNYEYYKIAVCDVMHGSTRLYDVSFEYLFGSDYEKKIDYCPELNTIYFAYKDDSIINTETGEVVVVAHSNDWHGTTGIYFDYQKERIYTTDNNFIIASNLKGEELYKIACPEGEVVTMTSHNGEFYAVYSNGTLYRYEAETGELIAGITISRPQLYNGTSMMRFDDAKHLLYIKQDYVYNIIDTNSWVETAYLKNCIGYHEGTDSFIVFNENVNGELKLGYFKQYSLEELIQRGQKMLEGAEISDAFKDSYGIG